MRQALHVVRTDGGWAVKREGNSYPIFESSKQQQSIEAAVSQAKLERTEVIIHGRDNKIRARESYGNDPFPPRDREH